MKGIIDHRDNRRNFLVKGGVLIGLAALLGPACSASEPEGKAKIAPTEDLMTEHGVLARIMLIYAEIGDRLTRDAEFPLMVLLDANDIIRRFIQDYHEKNEEDYLFARFSKAKKLPELVAVLYQQHLAGRKVIDALKTLSTADNLQKPSERVKIAEYLHSFNRMYRPHAAWEDSVLFPAFRAVISAKEFDDLGGAFAEKEQKLFGKDGFGKIVGQVADLEKKLGLDDLRQFIPKPGPAQ